MKPKRVNNSDFKSIDSKTTQRLENNMLIFGDCVHVSKYEIVFKKGYKAQFSKEFFEVVANATQKPPTHTIKDEKEETLRGIFYEKEMIRVL